MAAPAKKKFPAILGIIGVCFVIYLAVVIAVIVMHYKRPANSDPVKKVNLKTP